MYKLEQSRFKVEDNLTSGMRNLLSWACIRLDRLRSGFRFVGLIDPKGNPIPGGKLLVKVEKTVLPSGGGDPLSSPAAAAAAAAAAVSGSEPLRTRV
jgi:hypothetical protein